MQQLLSQPLKTELTLALKQSAARLIDAGIEPQLAVILVGNHPDSLRYISVKSKAAKEAGIILSLYHLEEGSSFEEVKETIQFLNTDSDIHGIILQLPLPESFTTEQTDQLLALVDHSKDVDGLTGSWQTKDYTARTTAELQASAIALPPVVSAVVSLLDFYQIEFSSKRVVLVGRGRLVGAPLEAYFKKMGVIVTSVDEETNDILEITKTADLLITGAGQNDLITYQWIKEGAVVIDCAADVHEDSVTQVASALAPSKGGIGPLTVVWLLHNTLQAAAQQGGVNV